jgi:lipoprotein-anchoring transpeptidase ErfK/SrfK
MGYGILLMHSIAKVIGLIAAGVLSACVPATGPATDGPQISTAAPPPAETAYLATQDGPFAVPAIPLEQLPEGLRRQKVQFPTDEAPGTIIINPAQRVLYFVTGPNQAIRYGISVGREGFEWSGVANVTDRKPWPTWTPPAEMIERDPKLAQWKEGQPGGPSNPLGARALYLTTNGVDYGYRIHGTPDWQSIGRNASSGCIRMINQDVMDLYSRVPANAKVIVMNRDGSMPTGLTLPPPQPRREPVRSAAPAPVVVAPVVVEPLMPALPPVPVLDPDLIAPPAVVTPAAAAPAAAPVTLAPAQPAG